MKNLFHLWMALCLLTLTTAAKAQYDPEKINKKAKAAYERAILLAQDNDYNGALQLLTEAVRLDKNFIEAYLSEAGIYGELKDPSSSVATYEKAFALDSNYTSEFRLPYSINLAGLGQFDKALATVDALLAREKLNPNTRKAAEYRRKTYLFALDYARTHPTSNYVFAPQNLGDGVNTRESEYFPTMPIDGKALIFTRRLNGFNEDFFVSENFGKWETARRLNGSINTPENEGAQNISQDGTWLVFTGCNRPNGVGSCDIFMSILTKDGWSQAMNMGNKINTEDWESQPCLSPDKRDLYFVSNRPGGFGGLDIYVSHLQANGRWSDAENLGPEINTSGNEETPFIHADNQTLYFASNGHPGYGEADLFVSRRPPGGKWGKPENLGYPINTINREGSLFIAADGKTAYYASDRADGKGGMDIYSFELRQDIRPNKTLWVKGKVFDQKTKAGLPSAVELIDLESRQTLLKVQTDEEGNYLVTLPEGRDYAFNVARKGYLFYSDNYSLKGKVPDSTYKKDIPLQPIDVAASVVLRNIFFDFNKYELKDESQVELDRIVQLLTDNPSVKIQIEGHTDNIGSAADNQKLSENRAKAVVNYLKTKGIAAERLSFKGYGLSKPIADNTTDEGRAQNRRTELKVVAK